MRRIITVILALGALAGLSAVLTSSALADGDPASDVLLYAPVFHPPNLAATPEQIAELDALVNAMSKAGYPIKVALIPSQSDLGTVTQLWGDPLHYASYLGTELSDAFRGRLLVVMPVGYELREPTPGIPRADHAAMTNANLGAPGSQLVQGAYNVVLRLAKANGIAVPAQLRASTAGTGSSGSVTAWIVFAVGLLIVAGAWALSLARRPARLPRRKVLA